MTVLHSKTITHLKVLQFSLVGEHCVGEKVLHLVGSHSRFDTRRYALAALNSVILFGSPQLEGSKRHGGNWTSRSGIRTKVVSELERRSRVGIGSSSSVGTEGGDSS